MPTGANTRGFEQQTVPHDSYRLFFFIANACTQKRTPHERSRGSAHYNTVVRSVVSAITPILGIIIIKITAVAAGLSLGF